MKHWVHWLKNCDSHHRLLLATAVAFLVGIGIHGKLSFPVSLVVIWDTFSACVLITAWIRIASARPRESLKTAGIQDSSRATIFLFVVAGAMASIFAVAHLLGDAHAKHGGRLLETTLLAFLTLMGSWTLIHTVFTLRYAHLFYGDPHPGTSNREHRGGLEFPGESAPDYLDFAYFAFVIGMTCQVSDVVISGREIRRLALVHGWLAFIFNTVLLAISINIASGLFGNG